MTDGLEAARREVRGAIIRYPGAIPAGALVKLEKAVREDERASESALRAAAQRMNAILWREDLAGFDYTAEYDEAANQLKAALDGAPWEPSEEMVERAVEAMIDSAEETDLRELPVEARRFARAALKAAVGSATIT